MTETVRLLEGIYERALPYGKNRLLVNSVGKMNEVQ